VAVYAITVSQSKRTHFESQVSVGLERDVLIMATASRHSSGIKTHCCKEARGSIR
jgi:hypothetical protein